MFESHNPGKDAYIVCTNGILRENNSLVMGAGQALDANTKFKGLDVFLGTKISDALNNFEYNPDNNITIYDYGVAYLEANFDRRHPPIIALQTKLHYKDKTPLALLVKNIPKCFELIRDNNLHSFTWNIGYPGAGYGGFPKHKSNLLLIETINKVFPKNSVYYNIVIWDKE